MTVPEVKEKRERDSKITDGDTSRFGSELMETVPLSPRNSSQIKHKCPVHSSRQLSDSGYCVDCNYHWAEPVLRGYTLQYYWAKTDYQKAMAEAQAYFQTKVGELREKAKEANKRFLEGSK